MDHVPARGLAPGATPRELGPDEPDTCIGVAPDSLSPESRDPRRPFPCCVLFPSTSSVTMTGTTPTSWKKKSRKQYLLIIQYNTTLMHLLRPWNGSTVHNANGVFPRTAACEVLSISAFGWIIHGERSVEEASRDVWWMDSRKSLRVNIRNAFSPTFQEKWKLIFWTLKSRATEMKEESKKERKMQWLTCQLNGLNSTWVTFTNEIWFRSVHVISFLSHELWIQMFIYIYIYIISVSYMEILVKMDRLQVTEETSA